MQKNFTRYFFTSFVFIFSLSIAHAQTIIAQWNFNSVPPDAATSTGSTTASIGTGALSAVVVTPSFASGVGSTDPATADNSGLGLTAWAAQGTNNKTRGLQFSASTAGLQNIVVSFDLRHSNTGPKHFTVQYTTDVSATTPVWVDFILDSATVGDAFINNRSYNFSSITALNNNANAGFRVVASFRGGTSTYVAATSTSTYGTGGTWRFDMVTIKTAPPPSVSFVGTTTNITETTTTVDVIARLQNGGSSAASADLTITSLGTATQGSDYTLPGSLQFSWPAFSDNVNDTVTITINNDVLAENTEYFIAALANGVNTSLPPSSTNNFSVFIQDDDKTAPTATQTATLNYITSFSNGAAGTNSAEIVAHDPTSQRLFIANSIGAKMDIVNFSNPSAPTLISSIPITAYGNINSIAVRNGIVAAAIEDAVPENNGKVVFFDINGTFINQVSVGAMPDMILFNNAGTKVLTANEGQPRADYVVDPEGSVSIIDISGGIPGLTQTNVTTASFASYNSQAISLRAAGVRLFGLNSPTVAQDMEPEYITLSADDNTAYVTCQENNAIAVINVTTGVITDIRPLGTKDHNVARNGLDASDVSGAIQIANWPVKGLYMPDAIASYTVGGQLYYVTANEGDSREYVPGYIEAVRLSATSYVLDPTAFPNADALKANLGRLNVSPASGDTDNDGDFDEIHAFGARSFSIWNATTGALVWDSGDELELITSKHPTFGAIFNASNANNTLKNRSDDKGPEPEGVTIAQIAGRWYAFIALERIGGCMVYDITNPSSPVYADYKNTRTIGSYGGDNGAEGIIYITAANSPTGNPIVILANEVSSTLSFFTVNNSVLDITLSTIRAANVGKKNQLEWNTLREEQGDVFELQRSKDGVRFNAIGSVGAKGMASSYNYWDETAFEGINYYRLKLKHLSGEISYSAIVSATVKGDKQFITVYPNPVKNELAIRINGNYSSTAFLELIDVSGRIINRQNITSTIEKINMAGVSAGIYTVRFSDDGKTEMIRVVKE